MTVPDPIAVIRRLPIVADTFAGLSGQRPWIGGEGHRRLVRAAGRLATERGAKAILHVGARDLATTIVLGQAARRSGDGAGVVAADSWVPGPDEWLREPAGGYEMVAPPDRLRVSAAEALIRERLHKVVTPIVADPGALNALAQSRRLSFDLIVWSRHTLLLSAAAAGVDLDLLWGLLREGGALLATLPVHEGHEGRLQALTGGRAAMRRSDDLLLASAGPLPDWFQAKPARRGATAIRAHPRGRHALFSEEIRVSFDGLKAGEPALVTMEPADPLTPEIVLAEDWTGTGEIERRLFAEEKGPGLELFVAPGGISGIERQVSSHQTLAMSAADADGRPFVDAAPDGSVLFHDRLQRRGLIDFSNGQTLVNVPDGVKSVGGTIFAAASFDNYFHWHNDVLGWLPYVMDVQRRLGSGPIRIAAPYPLTGYRRRSLELLGIDPDGYIEMTPGRVIRAREVLVAQPRHGTLTPRRAGEAFAMLRAGLGVAAEGSGRVWISRSDVGIRAIANEEALRPELERRGYRMLALGGMDYDEKIRIFAGTALAVGPHGAGFTHAGFMGAGGTVAELFTAARVRRYIPRLAAAYRLRYGFLCVPYMPNPSRSFSVEEGRLWPALDRLEALQAGSGTSGSSSAAT